MLTNATLQCHKERSILVTKCPAQRKEICQCYDSRLHLKVTFFMQKQVSKLYDGEDATREAARSIPWPTYGISVL